MGEVINDLMLRQGFGAPGGVNRLAELVGVKRREIWLWRNGRAMPNEKHFARLAEVLGTTPAAVAEEAADRAEQAREIAMVSEQGEGVGGEEMEKKAKAEKADRQATRKARRRRA